MKKERYEDILIKSNYIQKLSNIYKGMVYDMDRAELQVFQKKDNPDIVYEFMLLFWSNGSYCCMNANHNSYTANARLLASMLDGGKYECVDMHKQISSSDEWERVV